MGTENKPYIESMREIRKSNAAQPHRNRKKYHRPTERREVKGHGADA